VPHRIVPPTMSETMFMPLVKLNRGRFVRACIDKERLKAHHRLQTKQSQGPILTPASVTASSQQRQANPASTVNDNGRGCETERCCRLGLLGVVALKAGESPERRGLLLRRASGPGRRGVAAIADVAAVVALLSSSFSEKGESGRWVRIRDPAWADAGGAAGTMESLRAGGGGVKKNVGSTFRGGVAEISVARGGEMGATVCATTEWVSICSSLMREMGTHGDHPPHRSSHREGAEKHHCGPAGGCEAPLSWLSRPRETPQARPWP
jgi:hypothetical protein